MKLVIKIGFVDSLCRDRRQDIVAGDLGDEIFDFLNGANVRYDRILGKICSAQRESEIFAGHIANEVIKWGNLGEGNIQIFILPNDNGAKFSKNIKIGRR